jgi:hypothetical protein
MTWRKITVDDHRRNPRLTLWRHSHDGLVFTRTRDGAPLLFPAAHLSDADVVRLVEDLPEE